MHVAGISPYRRQQAPVAQLVRQRRRLLQVAERPAVLAGKVAGLGELYQGLALAGLVPGCPVAVDRGLEAFTGCTEPPLAKQLAPGGVRRRRGRRGFG